MNWKVLLESFFITCLIFGVIGVLLFGLYFVYTALGMWGYAGVMLSLFFIAMWLLVYITRE